MLAATYRELELDVTEPFNQIAADLNRERLSTHIKMARFDQQETGKMLAVLFAEEITPSFLEGIYRTTEGNPFFIEEVCKELVESGQIYYQEGAWHRPPMDEIAIPHGVSSAIQSRASKLPEEYLEVLRLAAIFGHEFDFDMLDEASDLDQSSLIDALEAAERAQLIESMGGISFSFTHNLIPTALLESIHALRRRLLHQRVAQVIERTRSDNIEALAYHYSEAGDVEKALLYYTRAGQHALRAFANQEAFAYFQSAMDLVEEPKQKADLLLQQGIVLSRLGRFEKAITVWGQGIGLFRRLEEVDQVAYLYSLSARAAWERGEPKRGLEIARDGMELVSGASDGPGLAELYHEMARELFMNGEQEEGSDVIQQSLEMAERVGALQVRVEALISLGSFTNLSLEEKKAFLEQAAELAQAHQLPDQEARARNNLCVEYSFGLGQFDRALEQIKQAIELARKTGSLSMELFYGANAAFYSMIKGDLKSSGEQISDLWQLSNEIGEGGAGRRMLRGYEAGLARYHGRRNEALEENREVHKAAVEVNDSNNTWMSAIYIAELLLEMGGDLQEAIIALNNAFNLSYGGDGWPLCLLAVVYSRQGEQVKAREQLNKAMKVDEMEGQLTDKVWLLMAEGELTIQEGKYKEAVLALEAAVELLTKYGMRWYRAYTILNLSILMRSEGRYEKARALLEEARDEFGSMGAKVYVKEIQAELKVLGD